MNLVERTETLLIAYQAGDLETLVRMADPEVRLAPLTTELQPGPEYLGPEGLKRWVRELAESGREYQPAVTGIEQHGQRVLVTGSVYASSPGGTLERTEAAWVFAFGEDGRVRWMRAYLDLHAARSEAAADDAGA